MRRLSRSIFVVCVVAALTAPTLYARGLTSFGRPRKNQRHPDLAGLPLREYRRRYQAKYRSSRGNEALT